MPNKEVIYGGYGNLILAIFPFEKREDLLPIEDEDKQKIDQALESIYPREAEVIKLRFGLKSESKGLTLKEIAEKVHVSSERARQIEVKALYKLKHPARRSLIGELSSYFKSSAQSRIEALTKENEELKAKVSRYEICLNSINRSISEINRSIKEADTTPEAINENLYRSVDELELSVRSANCLKHAGIKLIGDLVSHTEAELLLSKNFGRKSLSETKEILAEMGLTLNMKIPGGWLTRPTT